MGAVTCSAISLSCRPWSHPTTPPSRALWELSESSPAFLSLAVFLTKCLLLVSYSLTKTKTWFWRCSPTWQWSLVHADNTLWGLLAMPGWSLAVWGRGVGGGLIIPTLCLHCQCISFGKKRENVKESKQWEWKWNGFQIAIPRKVNTIFIRLYTSLGNGTWLYLLKSRGERRICRFLRLPEGHSDLFLYKILEAAQAVNSYLCSYGD